MTVKNREMLKDIKVDSSNNYDNKIKSSNDIRKDKENFEEKKEEIKKEDKNVYQIININKADIAMLDTLPGIGKEIARKIVEYRDDNGAFLKIEDILKVSGIGDAKFKKIKKYIEV